MQTALEPALEEFGLRVALGVSIRGTWSINDLDNSFYRHSTSKKLTNSTNINNIDSKVHGEFHLKHKHNHSNQSTSLDFVPHRR